MVRFDVKGLGISSLEFGDQLLAEFGIRVSAPGPTLVRLIPHLGISETDVDVAAEAIQALAKKLAQ
jgi:hypothetical protein